MKVLFLVNFDSNTDGFVQNISKHRKDSLMIKIFQTLKLRKDANSSSKPVAKSSWGRGSRECHYTTFFTKDLIF